MSDYWRVSFRGLNLRGQVNQQVTSIGKGHKCQADEFADLPETLLTLNDSCFTDFLAVLTGVINLVDKAQQLVALQLLVRILSDMNVL